MRTSFSNRNSDILDRSYWGQGYASEAAARVFEYASSTMPFRRIVSAIHPDNAPSIKIAKKCGARQENNVLTEWAGVFPFRMAGELRITLTGAVTRFLESGWTAD